MKAKLSQQRFWPCQNYRLRKTISMIPQNLIIIIIIYFRDIRSSPDNIFHENGCNRHCKIYICIPHLEYGMFQYCIVLYDWNLIVRSKVFFCNFCLMVNSHMLVQARIMMEFSHGCYNLLLNPHLAEMRVWFHWIPLGSWVLKYLLEFCSSCILKKGLSHPDGGQ